MSKKDLAIYLAISSVLQALKSNTPQSIEYAQEKANELFDVMEHEENGEKKV